MRMCKDVWLALKGVEKLSIAYALFSGILVCAMWGVLDNPMKMMIIRAMVVGCIAVVCFMLRKVGSSKIADLMRVMIPLGMLAYWYPETYEFNRYFKNLDPFFAGVEQSVFGFQPAALFAERFSACWVSEMFNLGYFSYFPMIIGVALYTFFCKDARSFDDFTSLVLGGFFIYYVVFIFVPVVGPQYYYEAIGMENVANANFVDVGNYFQLNNTLMHDANNTSGVFQNLVHLAQCIGERPTAAFPSSHVGISTLILLWAVRNSRRVVAIIFPFYLILCGATVYIQAHYLIDVFAGLISGVALFYLLYVLPKKWR